MHGCKHLNEIEDGSLVIIPWIKAILGTNLMIYGRRFKYFC